MDAAWQAPAPTPEHAWLLNLVGRWKSTGTADMGSDQESAELHGKETIRAIGETWIVSDIESDMPSGGRMSAVMTLGYDPEKARFQATWIDSVMNRLWVYGGSLDADRKILTLEAEGPDFTDPNKTALYRDSIEVVDANHKIVRSAAQNADGSWTTFMTTHFRRIGK